MKIKTEKEHEKLKKAEPLERLDIGMADNSIVFPLLLKMIAGKPAQQPEKGLISHECYP